MEPNILAVEEKIQYYLKRWDSLSRLINIGICILGTISITGVLFVSTFLGKDPQIAFWIFKTVSFCSAASLGLITSYDMANNRDKYRSAWRLLNTNFILYQAGKIEIEELISSYSKGEEMIGKLSFFNPSIETLTKKENLNGEK